MTHKFNPIYMNKTNWYWSHNSAKTVSCLIMYYMIEFVYPMQ